MPQESENRSVSRARRFHGRCPHLDDDTGVARAQDQAEAGEVVAAVLDGEATVKRDGSQVRPMAENPSYDPICGDTATILGKVVTVLRTLQSETRNGEPAAGT
ncbi:LexA family protein [Streptomyces sp. NPDC057694]|uniref:LexA family protein n=1 Tax=Streptomyces sp. NPDC057694 TaxID=3346216 RepID=UPI0036C552C1